MLKRTELESSLDVLKSNLKKWHFPSIFFLNTEQVIEQK